MSLLRTWNQKELLLYHRWPWHLLFWTGYVLFRFYMYYITIAYYPRIFLEYMLISELFFAAATYLTIYLYKRRFETKKWSYFLLGALIWVLYLCGRTAFQFHYLRNEPGFRNANFTDIFINSVTVVIVSFLFITASKYFKDGYINQHFEAERKEQQLMAEVNNLKSQIAPHFLFNTLNNLYGLAVDKSDKLPHLMLRLSDLLRHSLYETQKPLVPVGEEVAVIKSYIELESIRLEDNLKMRFDNSIPPADPHLIAPLILIVFIENAFKHAKLVQFEPVDIFINSGLQDDWFQLTVRNNYKKEKKDSPHGIGLTNVVRRLEVLYPNGDHNLLIHKDENFYTVRLQIKLTTTT